MHNVSMKSSRRTAILLGAPLLSTGLLAGCGSMHANPHDAFMGDSITEGWTLPTVNLGIHGQTTAQMLERFPRQVPGHGYTTVFILGGTNDTLLHLDPQETIANLGRMVDLAQAAKIEPVLSEIPPIFRDNGAYSAAVDAIEREDYSTGCRPQREAGELLRRARWPSQIRERWRPHEAPRLSDDGHRPDAHQIPLLSICHTGGRASRLCFRRSHVDRGAVT